MRESTQAEVKQVIYHALQIISYKGHYQHRLLVFFICANLLSTFSLFGPSYLYMNPRFICQGSSELVQENEACARLELCQLQNTYTLTAETGLYCGAKKDDRNSIQASFGLGCMLGVLLVNFLGSFSGRRVCLILSLIVGCIHAYSLLLGGFTESTALLVLSQLMGGASHLGLWVSSILYVYNLAKDSYRSKVTSILAATNGAIYTAFFTLLLPKWQYMVFFMVIAYSIVTLLSFCIINEDPIYSYMSGDMQGLHGLFEKISQVNEASPDQLDKAWTEVLSLAPPELPIQPSQQSTSISGLLDSVSCAVIQSILLLGMLEMCFNLIWFGSVYQIQEFKLEPKYCQIAMGVGDLCGPVVTFLIIKTANQRLGRVNFLTICLLILTVTCTLFVTPFPYKSVAGTITCLFAFRMLAFVFWVAMAQFWSITFPKNIQNVCVALVTCLGGVSKLLAPLAVRIALESHKSPFYYWMIILVIFGIIPSVMLPRNL